MRLTDTVSRMRELLLARGAILDPGEADADGYDGDGAQAQVVWEAFRTVAGEDATDPVFAWDEMQPVADAGFMFEALFSSGWPKNPHNPRSRAMPEHFELMFTRQFEVGEYGDLKGLDLTIFVPAADDLRSLRGDLFSDGPDAAAKFIAAVEADPAFTIPMTRHVPERFAFGLRDIG